MIMSIEQNKKLAAEFFGRFDANDVAGALACLADDATWFPLRTWFEA